MIRSILVALDDSPRAPGVFAAAVEIARGYGSLLWLFHAIFIPPEFPAAAAGSPHDPLPAHLAADALNALERMRSCASDVVIQAAIVRGGVPWRCIVTLADELDVDLIVVGSHGYGGLDRILGTTAARVANVAHRSVLVVHERPAKPGEGLPASQPYR